MKAFAHFCTITKHKKLVLKECFRVGLYKQGLLHDMSKYSWTEFRVGCRYYQGTRSPNNAEREEKGYSSAWLHHKGRNKHHYEYWIDTDAPIQAPVMPYKYTAEMICDKLAAGLIYSGEDWTPDLELNYYMKEREYIQINEKIDKLLIDVFTQVKDNGIEKTLTKQNIRNLYKKYCE
mgnify:CR=1 FL=1